MKVQNFIPLAAMVLGIAVLPLSALARGGGGGGGGGHGGGFGGGFGGGGFGGRGGFGGAGFGGPRGGAAVVGPRGGAAVVGPRGNAAVVGPRGNAAFARPAAVGERSATDPSHWNGRWNGRRYNHGRYGYYGGFWGWGWPYDYGWPYYDYGWPYYDDDYYYPGSYYGYYNQPATTVVYGSGGLAVNVQRQLKRAGYYRGGIDGQIGPESRAAIRAYQANHGLAITGRIDTALVRSLSL